MKNILKPKILIVDDDSRILDLLKQFFEKNGFDCSIATDCESAEKMINDIKFDLVILDVMLPKITGFDFAEKIKSKLKMPIIMLTALSEPDYRVKGLQKGADDYVTKPFDPRELKLRAQNLIEIYKTSTQSSNTDFLFIGDKAYNLRTKELIKDEELIILTSTEKKLLEYFVQNIGKVLSRDDLSKLMGGLSDRSIDVQIVRLRQKIEADPKQPKFLQTIRHEGYGLFI